MSEHTKSTLSAADDPMARPGQARRRRGAAGKVTTESGGAVTAGRRHGGATKGQAKARRKAPALTAKAADRHVLYQASVQDTSVDIRFINRIFSKERGSKPTVLREDFCGTAKLCADWVRKHPERRAIGLDLDQPTLDWGMAHNVAPLGDDAKRVELLNRNVLDGVRTKSHVTVAFNFSYCVFKARRDLVRYFKAVRRDLTADGVFMLDIHGGTECFVELEEDKKLDGFVYVWDQEPYDAINGFGVRHIHFRFPDGSEMRRAFTYDWRLWNLPEVTDALYDAGFSRVDVYWEGADGDGGGNGIFRRAVKAENEESWIAYVIAWR